MLKKFQHNLSDISRTDFLVHISTLGKKTFFKACTLVVDNKMDILFIFTYLH